MRRTRQILRQVLQEIRSGASAEDSGTRGVRKLRFLHSDESGLLTLSNLIVVLIMFTLISYVGNVVNETKQKLEIQNAADSVAYSSAVWMARGMNAITTTNHLVGELTALCVIHDAVAGPEADFYKEWEMTDEHNEINFVIKPLRFTAPVVDVPMYGASRVHQFDKKFVCWVTRVMMTNEFLGRKNALAAGAMIYDAKITLKKKSISYLTFKSLSNFAFFLPPMAGPVPLGVIAVPIAYATHAVCDVQLLNLVREWYVLDMLGAATRQMSRIKQPIETKLIPLLCSYSHFISTGEVTLPKDGDKKNPLTRPPIQNAIRSTGKLLKDRMGVEISTFPPPSELFLPVEREIRSAYDSSMTAQQIWGSKPVENNLSEEFLEKVKKLTKVDQQDPYKKLRQERRTIVQNLESANRKFEQQMANAKKANNTAREKIEELDKDDLEPGDKQDLNDELNEANQEVSGELKTASQSSTKRDEAIDELHEVMIPRDLKDKYQPSIDYGNLSKEQLNNLIDKSAKSSVESAANAAFDSVGCNDNVDDSGGFFNPQDVSADSFMDPEILKKERNSLYTDYSIAMGVLRDMKAESRKAESEKPKESEDPDEKEDDKPKTTRYDDEIKDLEQKRKDKIKKLEEAVQKMEEKLGKLDDQIRKAENQPDILDALKKPAGGNPSFASLSNVFGFDVDLEKYSQFGRATFPYLEGYRANIINQFKKDSPVSLSGIKNMFKGSFIDSLFGLKESEAAKHFVKWSNRYALIKVYQLRNARRWRGTNGNKMVNSRVANPKLTFYKDQKLKKLFLYQMKSGLRKNDEHRFRHKGTELWTGFRAKSNRDVARSRQSAEKLFSVVGFAYRKPEPAFFFPRLFHFPNSKGKLCLAQAMLYNGNAQEPFDSGDPQKVQPPVGWDTLNWKDVESGKTWKSLAPEFPSGLPKTWGTHATSSNEKNRKIWDLFLPGADFSHKVCETDINWQAKLAPVTRSRLRQASLELKNVADFDGNLLPLLRFVIRSENTQLINH